MKKLIWILLLALALVSQAFTAPVPQDAGQKMKEGVKKVGKGAKDMGAATAEGTKSTAKTVRKKTVKGAKTVGKATVKGTKTGVKKVGEGTEKVGKTIKKAGGNN